MRENTEVKGLFTQPRGLLKSSYFLESGRIIKPLLLFYLKLGLVCKKLYGFVQHTPMQCFNDIVQSETDAKKNETRIQILVLRQRR